LTTTSKVPTAFKDANEIIVWFFYYVTGIGWW